MKKLILIALFVFFIPVFSSAETGERLTIDGYYQYSNSRIADGSTIDIKLTNFDYIIIGPYRMNNFRIAIMNYDGGSGLAKGLLGMNFLKNVNYQIYYQRKIIKWLNN
ncbi:MAG: hypothetical protein GY860_00130 [Desulfobacteraceae bacterium]|nr:hypothetical protein [Desulfobacteraceae bacterium]